MSLVQTDLAEVVQPEPIPAVAARLRATYRSGRTRPLAWRRKQLEALERMMSECERELADALATDLGRTDFDSWLADLAPVTQEAAFARKNLAKWTRPKRVRMPLSARPGRGWYQYEPLGVALIIGPWNYPVHLCLAPLVGALAAGNCAIIKPSEHTPTVSAALARLLPRYVDPDAVAVVEGAAAETQELLDQALDHAFFTGGPGIGKAVMAAAAKHLTPVTLELGGKSPVIVHDDADVKVAARRVAWTKLLNSGQTCIAPDYVLVHRTVKDAFVSELNKTLDEFTAEHTDSYLPLVSTRHTERIAGLLDGSGGNLVRGGAVDAPARRAELSIVVDPDPDSALMREEIFGPVLPIVTVSSLDEAIAHVHKGPKPLAVYLFSKDRGTKRRILDEVSNGGTVINHLLVHALVPRLPFGGVGNSGMGAYHGNWGFETFSHRKAVLHKPSHPDPSLLYPPYGDLKQRILRRVF